VSSNESTSKTLIAALLLCVVCSIVVSGTAVLLKPLQDANRILDRNKNILTAAGMFDASDNEDADVAEMFAQFSPRIVDLAAGRFLSDAQLNEIGIDITSYDQRRVITHPQYSEALASDADPANIKRRVKYPMVYVIESETGLDTVVVPVSGYGLWGILYGFMALEGDLNTVKGLAFYELKETPGLGAEVRNPNWTGLWPGKKIYDENGDVALQVIKGNGSGEYQVDGLAGATLTTRGVDNLISYWLGEQGFGPFLQWLAESEEN